ncbi:MAG: riboflavin biosynthesis protein RibF [Kiritimatiellae bacterium]|nr:riboflavin biosynthesis protein RibF [Kiritimatiellia bacterium]
MLSVSSLGDLLARKGPLFLAAGFFDGVHVGHVRILSAAVENAHKAGGEAWVLTFDRHPRAILSPSSAPRLLSSTSLRLELMAETGVDGACVLPFTEALAGTPPDDFAKALLSGGAVAEVHCGENWRFGACAAGTPASMDRVARAYGARVAVEPSVIHDGAPVSSSRIRTAVADGDLASARAMLGRGHIVRAEVVHGRGEARRLGLPTANLDTSCCVLPPAGSYAVRVGIPGAGTYLGVGGVGFRPTFPGARPDEPQLEVHVLDFDGDLYGKTLDVAFVCKIRDEMRFPSGEALFAQIRQDIEAARAILGGAR